MTRTAAGWLNVMKGYRAQADAAHERHDRLDAMSRHASVAEDVLTADVYAEASYRALRDREFWLDQAAKAEAYAVDAELPATLSVVRADAGIVSAETAIIAALTCGSFLFMTACALIGLG